MGLLWGISGRNRDMEDVTLFGFIKCESLCTFDGVLGYRMEQGYVFWVLKYSALRSDSAPYPTFPPFDTGERRMHVTGRLPVVSKSHLLSDTRV